MPDDARRIALIAGLALLAFYLYRRYGVGEPNNYVLPPLPSLPSLPALPSLQSVALTPADQARDAEKRTAMSLFMSGSPSYSKFW
jgi:hypothetical protein